MKKQLLCTSAIALGVAAAAPASAQDWNLDWGGYFNQHIGFADVGGSANVGSDFDGIQMHSDAEIIFTPSVTLDNGLTFGINVQMEAANGGGGADGIDESYMSISGDQFGRLDVGFENSAGYKMMVGAPGVGSLAINSGSASFYIPSTGAAGGGLTAGGSTATEVVGPGGLNAAGNAVAAAANNDPMRLTYYTPSFNGFTAGVSYAPDASTNAANSAPVNANTNITDIIDVAVNYSQSYGTTDVAFSARYGTADTPVVGNSDPETWGIGAQVGFSGITIGGAYAENQTGVAGAGNGDSEGWTLGAAYDMAGPWTFGLEYFNGEVDTSAAGIDDEYEMYKLAGSRNLGPGVSVDVWLLSGEYNNGGVKSDGTAIGSSINLSF